VTVRIGSPVSGTVIALTEVPDPVFSQSMVGPGIAVRPDTTARDVVAPIDGTVVTLHPHAFVVATEGGAGVLVHLGIDTVKLKGDGFTLHVDKGDTVHAGQLMISWDPVAVESEGYSTVCPVIALDAQDSALAEVADEGSIGVGDPLFTWSA
jgi:sugar PTS system EIIA component